MVIFYNINPYKWDFTNRIMKDPSPKYTQKEILDELGHLEKQIISQGPFKMDQRTKEVVKYYLDNRERYEDPLMTQGYLEEIAYELLLRQVNFRLD